MKSNPQTIASDVPTFTSKDKQINMLGNGYLTSTKRAQYGIKTDKPSKHQNMKRELTFRKQNF
jgi:hypothetical protein